MADEETSSEKQEPIEGEVFQGSIYRRQKNQNDPRPYSATRLLIFFKCIFEEPCQRLSSPTLDALRNPTLPPNRLIMNGWLGHWMLTHRLGAYSHYRDTHAGLPRECLHSVPVRFTQRLPRQRVLFDGLEVPVLPVHAADNSQMLAIGHGSKRHPKGLLELWVAIITMTVGTVPYALTVAKTFNSWTWFVSVRHQGGDTSQPHYSGVQCAHVQGHEPHPPG